ncbi:Serine/threonine-protein kinase VRK1 [Orchesella cincta]|uniref:non-specific serine/threonine protein kinase n=1 Tax=Orchesella cincta TaxID=48709 RepID=A0A1D2NLU4_ORCCI|nr:Serine/threonine-protein kinase VRK1 [Orchesella cincta]
MPPKKPGAGAKAYSRADPMPNGEVLTDICGKRWKIGKSIGSGGFGEIYLASDETSKQVTDKANYVVKIEPQSNGPLFVEIAFYIRVAKSEMIDEWKKSHHLESLGMPCYMASGNHECKGQKYRFMIIPRFGQDLHKFIQEKPGKRLGIRAVQALSLQILDILEYIHEKGFVHGDIKASNLLLGLPGTGGAKKKQFQQIYVCDFGLAQKYLEANGNHVEYSPDNRKANNGTLEYSARDAHIGAFARRGDLEVLGYNMLEWLCGKLPWSADTPHDKVLKHKQALMMDLNLKKIYPTEIQGLEIVEKFLKYVQKLDFTDKPNYTHCKDILRKNLPSNWKGSLFLDDPGAGVVVKTSKTANKRVIEVDEVDSIAKKICVPEVEEEEGPKRSTRNNTRQVKDFNWAHILSTNPEKIVRSAASMSQHSSTPKEDLSANKTPSPELSNPTPAMLQILSRKKENIRSPIKAKVVEPQGTSDMTPAMKEVLMRRKKNHGPLFKTTEASTPSSSRRLRRDPQN